MFTQGLNKQTLNFTYKGRVSVTVNAFFFDPDRYGEANDRRLFSGRLGAK